MPPPHNLEQRAERKELTGSGWSGARSGKGLAPVPARPPKFPVEFGLERKEGPRVGSVPAPSLWDPAHALRG